MSELGLGLRFHESDFEGEVGASHSLRVRIRFRHSVRCRVSIWLQ